MKRNKLDQGIHDMLKLADYFDELGQNLIAANYRSYAEDFRQGVTCQKLIDDCRRIHSSLDNGPGRAPDLYFAHPDGKPDIEKTNDYMSTINSVRRFALLGMLGINR